MLRLTSIKENELKPKRRANSVDTLSPKSRFVNAINTIPLTPGVPYDTIIGDRGRGDSQLQRRRRAVLEFAYGRRAAEHIVPSGHSAHQNPHAIKEVHRILVLNARATDRSSAAP